MMTPPGDYAWFPWVEDGEIRFAFWGQDGYSEEVPDELVETMKQIDHDHGSGDTHELYRGPGPALIEHLTGIKLTPQILEGSSYLSGVISVSPAHHVSALPSGARPVGERGAIFRTDRTEP